MAGTTLSTLLLVSLLVLGSILISDSSEGEEGVHQVSSMAPSISFAGGDGTVGNPYQISNVTQLQNISANLTAHYILINGINASETKDWNGGNGFDPVGDNLNGFSGTLDGKGHNVVGLYINRITEEYVGLFGYLLSGAVIANISIFNCIVNGYTYVGGLVGYNFYCSIYNCSSSGNVTGYYRYFGGLVGYNYRGPISESSSSGNVLGIHYIGGFVGRNIGILFNCNSRSNVSGTGIRIGGLVGINEGTISNCSAVGDILGREDVGGLVGLNRGGGVINDSYAICNISTGDCIGDLVGNNIGAVRNSYYCIDQIDQTDRNCLTPYGIFEDQFENWLSDNRTLDIIDYLTEDPITDFYLISNLSDLMNILPFTVNGDYKFQQTSDIDLSSKPGFHIPLLAAGMFDGNGFSILNLNISSRFICGLGLFSQVGEEAFISNTSIRDCNVSGDDYGGGLVGINQGTLFNCTSNGNVSGQRYIGVLVGSNRGRILNCTSNGNVSGQRYIGVLVGSNRGRILNCTSSGYATGNSSIGGLLGRNWFQSSVTNCHSLATVIGDGAGGLCGSNHGILTNCYAIGDVSSERTFGGLVGSSYQGTAYNSYYCINYSLINNQRFVTPYGIYEAQFLDWMENNLSLNINDYLVYDNDTMSYIISNVNDLKNMLPFAVNENHSYIQTDNLDLSIVNGFYIPIFDAGVFNGNGFSISNLNLAYYNNGYIGLFGTVGYEVILKNINMTGYNLNGGGNAGGLIGFNSGTVLDSSTSGIINSDNQHIGGLVGLNCGIINNSFSSVDISGNSGYVGGLIGFNYYGVISNCSSIANIIGSIVVGGLIGSNNGIVSSCRVISSISGDYCVGGFIGINSGSISYCSVIGETDGNRDIGGLVGASMGIIENCFSAGNVSGNNTVGGLVGNNGRGEVTNSYTTCDIFGTDVLGGLIGVNFRGKISNCYSIGLVEGNGTLISGFVGDNDQGSVLSGFWDNQTSNMTVSDGGIGRNTDEMMGKNTFSSVGWNFSSIWGIFENRSYPYLRCMDYGMPEILNQQYGPAFEDQEYFNMLTSWSALPGGYGAYWNLTTNAGDWLHLTEDGILMGTPTNEDVGIFWVNVTATLNCLNFDFLNSSLCVNNKNDDPVLITSSLPNATEDEFYSFTLEAMDIDPTEDAFRWTMETNSNFLYLDEKRGIISGVPTNDDIGTWWVLINVSDYRGGFDEVNLTINVENVNDDPEILPLFLPYLTEDEYFFIDLDAIDIDLNDDDLKWSIMTQEIINNLNYPDYEIPLRINIDPIKGFLSGFATNSEVGTLWVEVTVTDEHGGSDQIDLYFRVINVNDDPVIAPFDVPLAHRDVPYLLELLADDIDPTNDLLIWDITTDATFLKIDSSTGKIWGLPTIDDVGTWWVNVTITDWNGGFDWENFTLSVVNDNLPPELKVPFLTLTMEEDSKGKMLALNDVFHDDDGDILSFEIDGYGPLTILLEGGIATFIPFPNWYGTEFFHITASDGEYSVGIDITVIVTSVNDAPMGVSIIAESSYIEGGSQVLSATAFDVDIPYGDILKYRWSSDLMGGIGFDQIITISLTEGFHLITVTVTDSEGISTMATVEIEILPVEIEERPDESDEGKYNISLILLTIFVLTSFFIVGIYFIVRRRKRTPHPNEE